MLIASETGSNLKTLLRLAEKRPDILQVVLVASDRSKSGALDIARSAGVQAWEGQFVQECGRWSSCANDLDRDAYRRNAEKFHDRLLERVLRFEQNSGMLDLVVLAYRRWIHGRFLKYFRNRIINQHPGDLAVLEGNRRALVGMHPVAEAFRRGYRSTRTSALLVNEEHDGGPVLAQGPEVRYGGPWPPGGADIRAHQNLQKLRSDRPVLAWTVTAWAEGRLAIDEGVQNSDGSNVVLVDGVAMALGGYRIPWERAAQSSSFDRS